MNSIFLTLGIESWKPLFTTLLLPPLPLLVMVLVGARLMFKRRLLAWTLILLGVFGIYFAFTPVASRALTNWLVQPPRALSPGEMAELKRAPKTAIVVLGAGRRVLAPEYGMSTLQPMTAERLRYGLWLARETGLPVAFTGGVGHAAEPGPSEGDIAARVAEREFGRPLRWTEAESRDTRENALKTVALLQPQGIERLVLVTDGAHMRRAMRNFEAAAEGRKMTIVAAPMALATQGRMRASDWLPDRQYFEDTWLALYEWAGFVAGA